MKTKHTVEHIAPSRTLLANHPGKPAKPGRQPSTTGHRSGLLTLARNRPLLAGMLLACSLAFARAEVHITEVARFRGPSDIANPQVADAVVEHGIGYVLDRYGGLYFLNLTNPASPQFIARAKTTLAGQQLALSKGYAYVVDGLTQWLQVHSVTNLQSASRIAMPAIGGASAIHISVFAEPSRDLIYLGGKLGQLRVIDVHDPSAPDAGGNCDAGPAVDSIFVANNLAYLALDSAGLKVFDVTSPSLTPWLWCSKDVSPTSGTEAMGVTARYPYAYVACGTRGLRVVNCDSQAEVLPGASTTGPAVDVKLNGNLAFVACGPVGVEVFDITNPALPVRVAQVPGAAGAARLWLDGNYCYASCGSVGLVILAVDYVGASLGRTVAQAGTTGSVPLSLLSWVELTNLSFTVNYPANALTNFSLSATSPRVLGQSLSTIAPGLLEVNLRLAATNIVGPLTNIGSLNFDVPPAARSAFARLELANVTGSKPDGTFASNGLQDSGRVVIVGEEPLLEMVKGTNNSRWISLYSLPGFRTQVLSCTNPSALGPWQPKYFDATTTGLVQTVGPLQFTNAFELFRATRVSNP